MKTKKNTTNNIKALKISIYILLGILLVILIARYITEEEFRTYVDTKILKKEVEQDTLSSIEINYEATPSIFAYDKYIAILNKNILSIYNADGTENAKLEINISNPIASSNGKYLIIAENDGKKLYLVSGTSILWQNEVDGEISRVSVNKNGYVSVIITNTIYKSLVVLYNQAGNELFRSFLFSTYAICADISNNNKYLAIGEVDYSGTIVKSYVKIISIALALERTTANQAVVNKYESEAGQIVNNIKYQDKDTAICMFNSYVQKVGVDSNERFFEVNNDALFLDINLENAIAIIERQSSGLFSYEYQMKIKNTTGTSENLYILDTDVPKNIVVSNNVIGINLGTEVQIVNSKGLLLKKYKSKQEIKGIAVGESIAGIIYKDKIELISL